MRRSTVAFVTIAAIVIAAPAATAKLWGELRVAGPGIDVVVGGSTTELHPDLFELPGLIGLFQRGDRIPEPTGALGARYEMTFFPFDADPKVVEYLYPFAEGGAVLHVRTPQRWTSGANGILRAGWTRADPTLLDILESYGLPTEPPVRSSGAGAAAPAAPGSARIPWAIGVLGGLLVLAATMELLRRGTEAARVRSTSS